MTPITPSHLRKGVFFAQSPPKYKILTQYA